jgi:hypothetical protein
MSVNSVRKQFTETFHPRGGLYYVRLSVDHQVITVAIVDTATEAAWWRTQLAKLLEGIIERGKR